MAKINFGPVVNDARGKTAGIVYSKNGSSAYVRTKVTGVNPRTPAQIAVRATFGTLSQDWSNTLTASNRAAWTSFAKLYPRVNIFGNTLTLNGLNTYVSLNAVILQAGGTIITTPPSSPATTPIPLDPTSLIANAGGAHLNFQQTAAAPTSGTLFYVYATTGLAPGRSASPSLFRFIGTKPAATTSFPATIELYSDWVAVFGDMNPGLKISILVSTVDPTIGVPTVGVPMEAIVA